MDERIFLLLLSDNTFVSLKNKGLSPICWSQPNSISILEYEGG